MLNVQSSQASGLVHLRGTLIRCVCALRKLTGVTGLSIATGAEVTQTFAAVDTHSTGTTVRLKQALAHLLIACLAMQCLGHCAAIAESRGVCRDGQGRRSPMPAPACWNCASAAAYGAPDAAMR